MAARLQSRLQSPPGRALGAPWRWGSNAGRWGRRNSAPALPPQQPPLVAAARPVVACCSAGSESQPEEPQPDKQPNWQLNWKALLHALAFAVLSLILLPAYILLVNPQPVPEPRQPTLLRKAARLVLHGLLFALLLVGTDALGGFEAPAWAEAAAGGLLGNGRVAEVLASCSILLSVPGSPTMQLCTVLALYCYYRCVLHLEAWYKPAKAGVIPIDPPPWFRALGVAFLVIEGFKWMASVHCYVLARLFGSTFPSSVFPVPLIRHPGCAGASLPAATLILVRIAICLSV